MGLSGCMLIQSGVIHHAPGRPIGLRSDNHPAAPCHGVIHLHLFQYTKANVSIESIFDSLLPMKWYLARGMGCNGSCFFVDKDAKRRRIVHQTQGLVFTDIECTGFEPVQYELAQYRKVFRYRSAWKG